MSWLDDLEAVVHLAVLTEDRSQAEQNKLLRVATAVDAQINKQSPLNTRLPEVLRPTAGSLSSRSLCTYTADHPKTCVCRGDQRAVEPLSGWSRLAELAADTWKPAGQ